MNKILTTSLFISLSLFIVLHTGKCNAQCSPKQSFGSSQLCPGDSVFEANHYIKTPGTYVYHYTISGGCDSAVTFIVSYKLNLSPFLDTAVCSGNPVTLSAIDSPAVYLWTTGDTTKSITVSTPGLYKVSVSYHFCTITDSMRISALPVIHLTTDTIICNGRSTPLNPTGSSANAYSWAPTAGLSCSGCANPVASPTVTTTYFAYVNKGSCSNSAQITIHVVPVNFSAGIMEAADDSLCEGETANLTLTGDSGIIHWQFSTSGINFADVSGQPGNNYLPAITKTTWFRVYSGNSYCSDTSNVIKITSIPFPSDTFITSTIDTSGLKIAFTPEVTSGAIRYHWNFGDSTTSTEISPVHTYKRFKNYTVCVATYNSLNCSDSSCRVIDVLNLGVPSVNDNDELTIYPNPSSGKITLKTNGNISSNSKIEINNLLGHNVYNSTLTNKVTEIDLNSLAPGIYFISLQANNKTVVKKLVKE